MRFIDQTGHTLELSQTPKRIISVVPSQSELIWDLGMHNELIGITKFCIHPKEMFQSKERVGGTKQLNIEKIKELRPDIIIANKEENEKEQIEELKKNFPVWTSDIKTLNDSLEMILQLGAIFQKQEKANQYIHEITSAFETISTPTIKKSTAYLIWKSPLMLAGRDTFINKMLEKCGLENIIKAEDSRYPEISIDELKALNPDYIFLSSEPFPFNQIHAAEFEKLIPSAKTIIVDGELFSWYGTRIIHSPAYFKQLIASLSK